MVNNIICGNSTDNGGGIECANNASPIIRNNVIINNSASLYGGGIYCDHAPYPQIIENVIAMNRSGLCGGGVALDNNGALAVTGNRIFENTGIYGGGLYVSWSDPLISGNIVFKNKSEYGGGIFLENFSPPLFVNNTVYENMALHAGGGIFCSGSVPRITSNTLVKNKSNGGGGIAIDPIAPIEITNTILWSNEAISGPEIDPGLPFEPEVTYCNVQGGYPGTGNIDSDPLFVDAASGDFHILFSSPCRASGDNSSITELFDFEGNPRIAYGTVDMGADEFYTQLYYTGDTTPGSNVELKFVGLPGTAPVALCIGTGVLDPPLPSMWGDWYLMFPIAGPVDLVKIPSPGGVLIIPCTIPTTPPPPHSIPMQALIGTELTSLCVMDVHW